MDLHFATSNENKFREAKEILAKNRIKVLHFPFNHNEMRSDSLSEIAEEAVHAAYEKVKAPVFVEDAGLFINALNGFPGTYSAWVQKKIGCDGILKLMQGIENRSAEFRATIAFTDGKEVHTFEGICQGSIAGQKFGSSGFGYDPIFIPEGYSQTFAQNIELKNKLSHRYKSLLEFSEYLRGASISR